MPKTKYCLKVYLTKNVMSFISKIMLKSLPKYSKKFV